MDIEGILAEYIFHKSFDVIIDDMNKSVQYLKDSWKTRKIDSKVNFDIEETLLLQKVRQNIDYTYNWANLINTKNDSENKQLQDIYINLEFHKTIKRLSISNLKLKRHSLEDVTKNSTNLIIVGDPGSGKTTTAQKITLNYFEKYEEDQIIPIVIRIRKLVNSYHTGIFELLLEHFGINLSFETSLKIKKKSKSKKKPKLESEINTDEQDLKKELVFTLIEKLNPFFIIDGYDETNNSNFKQHIIQELEDISLNFKRSIFLLTSRPIDYIYSIKNSSEVQIAELSKIQITELINKRYSSSGDRQYLKDRLISSNYFDTLVKPLNISQIFTLYDSHNQVPPQPRSIYKKLIWLFLEKWDEERNISRKSKYSNFQPDQKFDFLCMLAYTLTVDFGLKVFSNQHLKDVYEKIHKEFRLPKREMRKVISEIESHTGIFLKSGVDDFEFAHLTFQEYLTAEVLSRSITSLSEIDYVLTNLANELAIATALNFKPNQYLFFILTSVSADNIVYINSLIKRVIIEKPNFTDNPLLPLAIIQLYKYWSVDLLLGDSDLIYIKKLFTSKDLKASFSNFNKYYPLKDKIVIRNMKTYHLVRKLNIQTSMKSDMPQIIIIDNTILRMIKAMI